MHFCFHLHTIVFSCAWMLLLPLVYHWSCSNLCMVVLACVCPRLLTPMSGHSHLRMVILCLSLFPAHHCSPFIAPRSLLFPTCCCSPILTPPFFKVLMAPLLLLLLFAHCYSPLVFPHMVLLPPSFPFARSFWSYKQKPTSNKVKFFFLNFTFYFYHFWIFCFSFNFSVFCTMQYNFIFLILRERERNQKIASKTCKFYLFNFVFINRINPLSYLFFLSDLILF